MRPIDRDLIRGGHYGQRSCEPHQQAEHMAAPTNAALVKKILANSEPSTHGPKPKCCNVYGWSAIGKSGHDLHIAEGPSLTGNEPLSGCLSSTSILSACPKSSVKEINDSCLQIVHRAGDLDSAARLHCGQHGAVP